MVASSAWWWLRSPNVGNANNVFIADGQVNNNNAVNGNGVAPIWFHDVSIRIPSISRAGLKAEMSKIQRNRRPCPLGEWQREAPKVQGHREKAA